MTKVTIHNEGSLKNTLEPPENIIQKAMAQPVNNPRINKYLNIRFLERSEFDNKTLKFSDRMAKTAPKENIHKPLKLQSPNPSSTTAMLEVTNKYMDASNHKFIGISSVKNKIKRTAAKNLMLSIGNPFKASPYLQDGFIFLRGQIVCV